MVVIHLSETSSQNERIIIMTKIILKKRQVIKRLKKCISDGDAKIHLIDEMGNSPEIKSEANSIYNEWDHENKAQLETLFDNYEPLNQYIEISTVGVLALTSRNISAEEIKKFYTDFFRRKINFLRNVVVNLEDGLYVDTTSVWGTEIPNYFKKWGVFFIFPILIIVLIFCVNQWENISKIWATIKSKI